MFLTALSFPIVNPTWIFFVVLIIILLAPLVFERFHIPQIVGMILAGVLIGPHALNLLTRDSSFELFGRVGLYYIMFLAGLSMDVSALKHNRFQLISFGLTSYSIPFVFGGLTAHFLLHFSMPASILIACILSSHTLVAFSIVSRYGLTRYHGVTLSVVATMISLILSLLSLAVLAGSFRDESGPLLWCMMLVKAAVFALFLFLVCPRLVRYFFRHFSDDVLQYIFVLALVFFSAAVSERLGLEGVLGAFLAGLILNRYIPETAPLMRHIDFVGNALFIPYFLIGVGMLINFPQMFSRPDRLLVIFAIVVVALSTKWMACFVTDKLFDLGRDMRQIMTGLTTGHAAGALAMVMVGRQLYIAPGEPLTDDVVLNAMVMLILLSCIFSAFVTTSASKRIARSGVSDEEKRGEEDKILVALSNPNTTADLVNISLMMRPHHSTAPLVGVKLIVDAKDNERELDAARLLVKNAAQISASAGVSMKKVVRSGVNIVTGLMFTMKDFEASEIIIGAQRHDARPVGTFGGMVTDLLERISRQIIIVNCRRPVNTVRQIHVVVPEMSELEVGFHRWMMHVSRLARQMECRIIFYCPDKVWTDIEAFCHKHYRMIRMEHVTFDRFIHFPNLTEKVHSDHLLVLISARPGSFSWQSDFSKIPELVDTHFKECSVMLIFPDQYGVESKMLSFTTGFPYSG